MVDPKYRKIYQEKSKFRAMTVDKNITPDKYDTPQEAYAGYMACKSEDFLIVETFPGWRKFPCYGNNVKEDSE